MVIIDPIGAMYSIALASALLCCGPGLSTLRMRPYHLGSYDVRYVWPVVIYFVLVGLVVSSSTWWFVGTAPLGGDDTLRLVVYISFLSYCCFIAMWKGCAMHESSYDKAAVVCSVLAILATVASIVVAFACGLSDAVIPAYPIVAWIVTIAITLFFACLSVYDMAEKQKNECLYGGGGAASSFPWTTNTVIRTDVAVYNGSDDR
jgi:hypothetical protein